MRITECGIKGVYEIGLNPHEDNRGFFMRTYDDSVFRGKGLHRDWRHENHSFSRDKGLVRGLHFQYPPYAETKLVRAATGEIFIVLADLRKGSDTFGKWESMVISAHNNKMVYASRGLAMGMCTLTDNCTLLYKMDNVYSPENQGSIRWDDPELAIKWPVDDPILSDRDRNALSFSEFIEEHGGI